ncbi:MAG: helix-turn-helix domain-containing protein [Acidobacteria bacterium]|nr:helix-turn-helix domain-containing protein [Acidobacteriota bacterium]
MPDDAVNVSDEREPLAELGADFQREREARGVTLREIADTTKISSRFLEAIERGDATVLPAPVFTRGFIREYAQYLGLDVEAMVERYMAQVQLDERREAESEAELQERIRGGLPLIGGKGLVRTVIIVIVIGLILGVIAWMASSRVEDSPAEATGAPPAPVVPPARTATAEPEPVVIDSVEVTVRATEPTWMLVAVDGNATEEMTLGPGETRTFRGSENVTFERLGNAGGIQVSLNGVELDPLGRSGQIVNDVSFGIEDARRTVERGGSDLDDE